ncbi:hypothetical protein XELAEV_18002855mg [Xenopus laevis]|nr:hypothetical protein XELAEV_18002855mg [Xenopus laevis]
MHLETLFFNQRPRFVQRPHKPSPGTGSSRHYLKKLKENVSYLTMIRISTEHKKQKKPGSVESGWGF